MDFEIQTLKSIDHPVFTQQSFSQSICGAI